MTDIDVTIGAIEKVLSYFQVPAVGAERLEQGIGDLDSFLATLDKISSAAQYITERKEFLKGYTNFFCFWPDLT